MPTNQNNWPCARDLTIAFGFQAVDDTCPDLRGYLKNLNCSFEKEHSLKPNIVDELFSKFNDFDGSKKKKRIALLKIFYYGLDDSLFDAPVKDEVKKAFWDAYYAMINKSLALSDVNTVKSRENIEYDEKIQMMQSVITEIAEIIKPLPSASNQAQIQPEKGSSWKSDRFTRTLSIHAENYNSFWWKSSAREKQANDLFGQLHTNSNNHIQLLTQLKNAQQQIYKDVTSRWSFFSWGSTRLSNIINDMFVYVSSEYLKDPFIALKDKQSVSNLVTEMREIDQQLSLVFDQSYLSCLRFGA